MAIHCCFGTLYSSGYMELGYIQWDGTPDIVGEILSLYYKTEDRVRSLLSLGEISTLGMYLKGDLKNWNSKNSRGFFKYTMAYHRDLGEKLIKPRSFKGLDDTDNELRNYLLNRHVHYLYLFDVLNNQWLSYKLHCSDWNNFFEKI